MSFELMQECLDLKADGLTSSAKFVLVALARFADRSGNNCYPSIPGLHDATGLSERAIRNALARLSSLGLVSMTRAPGMTYTFRISLPTGSRSTGSRSATGSQSTSSQSTTSTGSRSTTRVVADRPGEEVSKKGIEKVIGGDKPPRAPKKFVPEEVGVTVTRQEFEDFIAVRKAKRSPLTETAWNMFKREAALANMSLSEAIGMCVSRGWISIDHSWESVKSRPMSEEAYADLWARAAEKREKERKEEQYA